MSTRADVLALLSLVLSPNISFVRQLRCLLVGARQEVEAPVPSRNEVGVLIALFGGSVLLERSRSLSCVLEKTHIN